ncbi:molybdopterin-guanine dinucleotide biosynthesis protein B [Pontibacillus marinus]|uniref:Molybdopterin-guanine dinucleotide biosynthesis protein B n=1 Tax=Pontibacillus marinus BH030004 = DSM 16465 TaxID=1385511 RepID=A0A0A5G206_9BACI|nr:molybdopterin-guanine dinucleotide biosynthesis protein B [Pontibacillus marinus]KGX86049.1 molybdopterin-guanine dinucleotide biosynthesis protein B [Pontibacillus marinus BH030004 = DSM 16465]
MREYPFVVLQVVGYKNSGKTSVITSLIQALQREGLKVGTLKHHGHGGEPDKLNGTDSSQHFNAGAVVSGVEGDGVFQWNVRQESWSLDVLLNLYRPLGLDIVLVEGFKSEPYPKWVLLRDDNDLKMVKELKNVQGIVSGGSISHETVPCIPRDKEEAYIRMIKNQIKGELDGK